MSSIRVSAEHVIHRGGPAALPAFTTTVTTTASGSGSGSGSGTACRDPPAHAHHQQDARLPPVELRVNNGVGPGWVAPDGGRHSRERHQKAALQRNRSGRGVRTAPHQPPW